MNSRERFLAGLKGEKPDRTPTAHVAALTTVELQTSTGCFMPAVHHDPEQMARLCAANHELLGFDGVSFIINYFGEPAALGCAMDWGNERTLPTYRSQPWSDADKAQAPADILDREPVKSYLETIRIAKKRYGGDLAVLGKVMGPFSLVQAMHGLENVMIGLLDDERKIAGLLDVAVDVLVRCANAQFEAGIEALGIGEGGAGANMLSPVLHERLLLPVHRRMAKEIAGPTIMHICGDITPRLDLLAKTGFTCFNFDWSIAPALMKKAAAGKYTIMGNISTTDLARGNTAAVEAQVRECVAAGVDIISPGCAISPACANATIRTLTEAVVL